MDKDNDGMLNKNDIFNVVRKLMDKGDAKKQVESIFYNIDTERNGKISYSEYLAANMDINQLFSEVNLRAAF